MDALRGEHSFLTTLALIQNSDFFPVKLPATHRPLPLCRRADLQTQRSIAPHLGSVVVKDPVALEYFRLTPLQFQIWQLLDGNITPAQILEQVRRLDPTRHVDQGIIQQCILDLCEKKLVLHQKTSSNAGTERKSATPPGWTLQRLAQQLLFFRCPPVSAEPLLNLLGPLTRWMFSPAFVALSGLWIVATWVLLLSRFDEFQQKLPGLENWLSWRELCALWLMIGLAKVIHELGHGLLCRHFGSRCHGIGVAFLMLSPCLYCDVTDAWMLPRQRERILIALGGIWVELLLSSLAILIWWNSAPGLIHNFSFQMLIVTSVSTVLFNSNPLLKYDGYYVLCDLLEIPNLQQHAQQAIENFWKRCFFGMKASANEMFADLPQSWILFYGFASAGYRWLIVFGIGLFLQGWFRPLGLQGIGWCYLGISLLSAVSVCFRMIGRVVTTAEWNLKFGVRCLLGGSAGLLLAYGIWNCPMPPHVVAPLILEPLGVQHVYVESAGLLDTVTVSAGDVVERGDPIARLKNRRLEDNLLAAEAGLRESDVQFRLAKASSQPDAARLAERHVETAFLQQTTALEQVERLVLTAPCAGEVISAASAEPGVESDSDLPADFLSDGDQYPHGLALKRRTPICSIAPSKSWQAVAWVREQDCGMIRPEQAVEIAVDAFPGRQLIGKVVRIAAADDEQVPPPLTSPFGGSISVQPSGKQAAAAAQPLCRVTIALVETAVPLRTGLRGSGQFAAPQLTVGGWLVRNYYRIFFAS